MTAEEYLKQIRRIDRLINNKIAEQQQLFAIATSITAATDGEAIRPSGVSDKVGKGATLLADLSAEIDVLVDRFVDLRNECIEKIEAIEPKEPLYYAILHGKYIQYKTLREIATIEGYSPQYIREQHRKALEYFEITYIKI